MNKQSFLRRSGIALALVFSFVYSNSIARAQSCPVAFNTTGSIAAGDATQSNRIVRNGVPSDCNGKAFPGLNDATAQNRRFDQYMFTNTNATPACIQVTFTGTIAGLHVVAYLNSFNPANVSQNYVGDLGVVYTANATASFSFSVPAMTNFVIVVHETTANGPANSYTLAVGCTTAPPPLPSAPGQVLISEFRLAGPGAASAGSVNDEFIELYNNTDGPLTIGNHRIRSFDPNFFDIDDGADFATTIPAGSVIPARGYFLMANTTAGAASDSYTLGAYATPDFGYTFGTTQAEDFFIDNEGIDFVTPATAATQMTFDSVGFTGSGGRAGEIVVYGEGTRLSRRTQTPPTVQYSYVRKQASGKPQDTDNNATDFDLVSVNASAFALAAGGTQQSVLGAPGPQRTTSPIQSNARIKASLIDSARSASQIPNRQRFGTDTGANKAFGTMRFRRKYTNTSGASVTQLRFRIVDLTTLGSPGAGAGQADLRAVSSLAGDFNVTLSDGTTMVPVKGTQVEAPTGLAQALGGGVNSSIITITPATPIAMGGSVNVEFSLGVQAEGTFRFLVNVEAVPGAPNSTSEGKPNSRVKGSANKTGSK